jgi:hypothetical protein
VILLTKASGGKVHDKRQLDEEDLVSHSPDALVVAGDLGFQDYRMSLKPFIYRIKSQEGKN